VKRALAVVATVTAAVFGWAWWELSRPVQWNDLTQRPNP